MSIITNSIPILQMEKQKNWEIKTCHGWYVTNRSLAPEPILSAKTVFHLPWHLLVTEGVENREWSWGGEKVRMAQLLISQLEKQFLTTSFLFPPMLPPRIDLQVQVLLSSSWSHWASMSPGWDMFLLTVLTQRGQTASCLSIRSAVIGFETESVSYRCFLHLLPTSSSAECKHTSQSGHWSSIATSWGIGMEGNLQCKAHLGDACFKDVGWTVLWESAQCLG